MYTSNCTAYTYIYDGSSLTRMTAGSNTLEFTYGANGLPMAVKYGSNYFYYVTNALGDVVAILNASGAEVVNYTYDAWGNITRVINNISNNLATHNPFRYRSYVYDQETGLYYLQSRYYNPKLCRFISADDPSYLGSDGTPTSYNLFAYCGNNPVNYSDPSGNSPALALLITALLLFTPIGGIVAQAATSTFSYIGIAMASIWDEDIRDDMGAIGWNPFNGNEAATIGSNKVSFYKGVPVFKTNMDRSGSFCAIFLNSYAIATTLRHEYGHNVQQLLLGPVKYGLMISLPSWQEWSKRPYYDRPWEITADVLGGVGNRAHSHKDIIRGFWYLTTSGFFGPLGYFFVLGES